MVKELSLDLFKKIMIKFQKAEATGSAIYLYCANHTKDERNRKILQKIADEEAMHAEIWYKYTGKFIKPNRLKVWWNIFLFHLLGYTFVLKILESKEYSDIEGLSAVIHMAPEVKSIIAQETEHEHMLIDMLDEERLNYVGAMVLGLNDALVELTGSIAGLTFVLVNTKLIAMAGIITGIAATLSMAASNYLAEKADGNPKALKASVYTGLTYFFTVVFLVLPYLIFPKEAYLYALITMIGVVIFLIFIFNYYISVVKSKSFWSRFFEMTGISLSVATISFLIGLATKYFFGIDL
ncbi:MAG: VIT1/CCC1 transporter family protein [Alphaproteobacteria bacterium]